MAWNGLGAFLLNPAFSPEVNGTVIDAVRYNGLTSDIAAGISAALAKNGENTPTANLPMAGFKHTGVGNANAAGQYWVYGQELQSIDVAAGSLFRVGFREIPQNSQSAAYTLVAADSAKHIYHPSADTTPRIWTIPANASVAYPIGTALTFINDTSGGVVTIAITSDTLILAGAGTTGSRSLAANGVATAVKMTATRWIISGTGLT